MGLELSLNNLLLCKNVYYKEEEHMHFRGTSYFVILGCNYENNIIRELILHWTVYDKYNINVHNDIIKEILSYLHSNIFIQIKYGEMHDHSFDEDMREYDHVDFYSFGLTFDPTFINDNGKKDDSGIGRNSNDTKSNEDVYTIARAWGRNSWSSDLKREFDVQEFNNDLLQLCDHFEVDRNQITAIITFLKQYYKKL